MATAARGAEPWGAPALRKLTADLGKGWPPGLTVLTGDDLYHLDRAQALILDHLVPNKDDAFGLSIVGDEAVTAEGLVGAARSLGMFAPRRVLLLRDIAGLSGEPEPLAAYAKSPPAQSWIVVRAPRLDRKRKLHKALAEAGICLTFRRAAGEGEFRELERVVAAMAASRGVALDEAAATLLVDVCGSDLYRLEGELEKMSVWLGAEASRKGETIGIATVRALVGGSGLLSGWELADALTSRDAEEAIAAARRLLDTGEEPIRTLGGIASRARSLLKAKAMERSGMPPRDIVDAARAWYFRDALARGLKRYTLQELLAMPSRLYEADRAFKSRALDKGAVLETLVIGLTVPSAERR
jgi:DNA polymerase III subunit delta